MNSRQPSTCHGNATDSQNDVRQTMSHIVESCPMTKLNGGLSRLHSADEDAVSWLNYDGHL